ncbi:hypothetical protein OS493_000584 [Desmophyllum pertusum]|uniref:Uncharacterized protein n=1 Tax=Desmophyllum pertusum TaxID=174260 RepID=A0A9X0DCN2_9CNID|nr:hypothetical protein OS493_000584 [Desmophyllum pertusum]
MAKIQAIVALVGILFIAALLVNETTCFVTRSKKEFKMVRMTREICAAARSMDCAGLEKRELQVPEDGAIY